MQVEQQVSDDELSFVNRYKISRAGGQQRLHQAPPGLQRMSLCTQTPTDAVTFHHLLQDRVHLLGEYTQEEELYLRCEVVLPLVIPGSHK